MTPSQAHRDLCDAIARLCADFPGENWRKLDRAQDQAGLSRSNYRALGGWHSKNDLHKAPAFAPLAAKIIEACAHISATLGYDPKYPLRIGTMWSIINPPGSSNRAHIHPGSLWSGVYYVAAPDKAGNIEFIDPRTAHLMNAPRYIEGKNRPQACWTKVKYDPIPGKMLILPSHLYHAVEPNLATEKGRAADRMIVSFNLGQRG